jgi:hypothetical protein
MKDIQQSPRVNSVDRFGQTQLDQFNYAVGTSGVIVVELFGSNDDSPITYTISAAQITAHLGKPLPYAVKRVLKSGTTATFSLAW